MIESNIVGIPKAQGRSMEVVYIVNKSRDFVQCDSPNGVLRFNPGEMHDETRKCMKPALRVHAAPIVKRFSSYLGYVEQDTAAEIMRRCADLGANAEAFFTAMSEIVGVDAESHMREAAQEKKRQQLLVTLARRGLKFEKDEKLEVLEAAMTSGQVSGLLRKKSKEEREEFVKDSKRKEVEASERTTADSEEKSRTAMRGELRALYKELTGEPAPRGSSVNDLKSLIAQAQAEKINEASSDESDAQSAVG